MLCAPPARPAVVSRFTPESHTSHQVGSVPHGDTYMSSVTSRPWHLPRIFDEDRPVSFLQVQIPELTDTTLLHLVTFADTP